MARVADTCLHKLYYNITCMVSGLQEEQEPSDLISR